VSTNSVSGGTLTNTGGTIQITGLASGINTNALIQAELEEAEAPITNMQAQVSGLQTMNNTLSSIQSALQTVADDAQALGDPTLFNPVQTVSSSNSALVSASSTNGIGGVIGGSTVLVTQLAGAASRTFSFTSPSSADTITVDGQQVQLQAGASSQDLANAINSSNSMDVWASATSSGQIVLSDRATGQQTGSYIQVSDPGGTLVEQTGLAQAGQNALYSVNGVAGSSASDTVTGAIPGVTLTLNGVTGTSNPVTVNVQPPAANTQAILAAVNQFVQDYNAAVSAIESAVNTQPANSSTGSSFNQDAGSLFGDPDLENLLSNLRTAMYSPGAGLPSGMASLPDIGISTGSSTGVIQQSSLNGMLTVDQSALTAALQSNPNGVEQVLQGWSQSFYQLVDSQAGPGGSLDARIQGDSQQVTILNNQISAMQALYTQQQKDMEEQWAQVEATLSQLQSQSSAFTTSYTAQTLGTASSSSSS
jgi:flagellar hook-associated protein 2